MSCHNSTQLVSLSTVLFRCGVAVVQPMGSNKHSVVIALTTVRGSDDPMEHDDIETPLEKSESMERGE
jgi:hypothetical protein